MEHGGVAGAGWPKPSSAWWWVKSVAGRPERRPLAGIAVFTGGLRESMIVEAETHEVDGTEVSRGYHLLAVGARCSTSRGDLASAAVLID